MQWRIHKNTCATNHKKASKAGEGHSMNNIAEQSKRTNGKKNAEVQNSATPIKPETSFFIELAFPPKTFKSV